MPFRPETSRDTPPSEQPRPLHLPLPILDPHPTHDCGMQFVEGLHPVQEAQVWAYAQKLLPPSPPPYGDDHYTPSFLNQRVRRYGISIIQQPVQARLCGASERDRRPIDPPPVVQLIEYDSQGICSTNVQGCPTLLCHVSLWNQDGASEIRAEPVSCGSSTTSCSSASRSSSSLSFHWSPGTDSTDSQELGRPGQSNPALHKACPSSLSSTSSSEACQDITGLMHHQKANSVKATRTPPSSRRDDQGERRVLIGSLVSSPHYLYCPQQLGRGVFFVFPDLSVRLERQFRLRFCLYDLGQCDEQGDSPLLASTFSDPFTVYSAKRFPGMKGSTPLSKFFAGQGVKIPLRSEARLRRRKRATMNSGRKDRLVGKPPAMAHAATAGDPEVTNR